jgi:hypothetical protein
MSGIRLERMGAARTRAQIEALHRVFASAPDYCRRVIGHIPALDEMGRTELPPGKTEDDHHLFGCTSTVS